LIFIIRISWVARKRKQIAKILSRQKVHLIIFCVLELSVLYSCLTILKPKKTIAAKIRTGIISLRNLIILVGLTGLEPVTLRLSSACSNQLSYRP
jgi:hypothetical protein